MASQLNKTLIGFGSALVLTACASTAPSNFKYETSLRGEQGLIGLPDKISAAEAILDAGVVKDPALALRAGLPNTDVKVRKWGLRYFGANWARYQVILDADITRGDVITECRHVSTETPVGAPTLKELTANNGVELQRHLEVLIASCVAQRG